MPLAVTVDGADEVDPHLNLIKGWGRALVREKIVAAASRMLVILVGPGKEVPVLGTRGNLPVEVVPFALPLCVARLRDLGLRPIPYEVDGKLFLSDNGNAILDCGVGPIADPAGSGSAHSGDPRRRRHGIVSRHGGRGAGRRRPVPLERRKAAAQAAPGAQSWNLAKEHEPCNWA